MKNLNVGDEVKWVSAAGKLSGKVSKIRLGKNANDVLVPWVVIETEIETLGKKRLHTVCLCGTDSYLKMMKFKKA
jgi:hypothetical protein